MRTLNQRRLSAISLCAFLAATTAGADPINGGELEILTTPPEEAIPYQSKTLTIGRESLKTGWITSRQCLYNVKWWGDAVQIVFGKGKIRALRITRSQQIGKVWVEDNTVQLEDIGDDAVICLSSENRTLNDLGDNPTLVAGPFKFQLFDGYFPMKINMRVDYPDDLITLDDVTPAVAPGINLLTAPGHIRFETTFSGVLWVKMRFRATSRSH